MNENIHTYQTLQNTNNEIVGKMYSTENLHERRKMISYLILHLKTQKSFDKVEHSFLIKTPCKLRQSELSQLNKGQLQNKLIVNIINYKELNVALLNQEQDK